MRKDTEIAAWRYQIANVKVLTEGHEYISEPVVDPATNDVEKDVVQGRLGAFAFAEATKATARRKNSIITTMAPATLSPFTEWETGQMYAGRPCPCCERVERGSVKHRNIPSVRERRW